MRASLKAVGTKVVGEVEPKEWSVTNVHGGQSVYSKQKWKWEL